ncbi:gem-associated protein 8-like isoform X2 [Eriocheir sinensis]|uniref:gem-associated protein 8-like isoform X2 n=1 Tax=Eriocheir sinensis TaxID=95602 RepID=UPI0021C71BC1|nr:gem-associated protein 8-like isoform X2 [Eriocheir sinensis]
MEAHASPWHNDSRFSYFWQHYNMLMNAGHQDAVMRGRYVAMQTRATLTTMSGMHHPLSSKLQQSHVSKNPFREKYLKKQRKRIKKNNKRKKRSISIIQGNQSDTESLYSQMRQGMHIQDTNEDMEVTEDFLAFLEQSKKHREEWKNTKSPRNLSFSEENILTSKEVAPYPNPKEHPDVIRSREMQELYGQASPKIQAMETALQLSFDRNNTIYQPKYWPNIPLNVMFN